MSPLFPSSSDWALDAVVQLDLCAPGLAGHYLRASGERRQVICTFLAYQHHHATATDAQDAGKLLLTEGHASILRRAVGQVPCGLRGALARSGTLAHGPEYYRSLVNILRDGAKRNIVEVLQHIPELHATALEIAALLPSDLAHPRIVARLHSTKDARDLVTVTEMMERAGLNRRAFVSALLATDQRSMSHVIHRWALKLPFPKHPLPDSDAYQAIRSGKELRRVALVYRNCSRGYLAQALDGTAAFGDFSVDGSSVLIHCEKQDGMWIYCSSNGYRNRRVEPALARKAEAYAAQYGVPARFKTGRTSKEVVALRRLGGLEGSW